MQSSFIINVPKLAICTSGKDVDIFATNSLNRGSGTLAPINMD